MKEKDTVKEKELERFFKEEWESRYIEEMPCEEIEEGCDGREEGTLVKGFRFEDRLLIQVLDSDEFAFFRQDEDDEFYPAFRMGIDVFKGDGDELFPKLAAAGRYQDDVVIFSEGKEIFRGSANIGEVIDKVIKEQGRLLFAEAGKAD